MAPCNQQLADGLRRHAKALMSGDRYRYALLIAATNIEAHPAQLETDRQALEVKGVGQMIINELFDLGLQRSHASNDLHFVEGANAARPGKLRRTGTRRIEVQSNARNNHIARELRRIAETKSGGFRVALIAASRNIKEWHARITDVRTSMVVPGVSGAIASVILCDILHTEMTDDDTAFLCGAAAKRQLNGKKGA